jgi:hypothetical protein
MSVRAPGVSIGHLSPRKRRLTEKKELKRLRREERRKQRREAASDVNSLILNSGDKP